MSCELILALDLPDRKDADPILHQLQGSLKWVKIGLQMFTAYGPDYVRYIADLGYKVFLDLKLHDIPNTVARAVESLAPLPIGMLTIHASGGMEMMQAARKAQQQNNPDLLLLAVTVLTSIDDTALEKLGISPPRAAEQVLRLAQLATDANIQGLVCSPRELPPLKKILPAESRLVTPGIRPAGAAGSDDQKRTMTPAEAASHGANYIVVGRPILKSADPAKTAIDIQNQLKL